MPQEGIHLARRTDLAASNGPSGECVSSVQRASRPSCDDAGTAHILAWHQSPGRQGARSSRNPRAQSSWNEGAALLESAHKGMAGRGGERGCHPLRTGPGRRGSRCTFAKIMSSRHRRPQQAVGHRSGPSPRWLRQARRPPLNGFESGFQPDPDQPLRASQSPIVFP